MSIGKIAGNAGSQLHAPAPGIYHEGHLSGPLHDVQYSPTVLALADLTVNTGERWIAELSTAELRELVRLEM